MGFETDIERMYRAGRLDMPAAAERLRGVVDHLRGHIGSFDVQSALAGDPQIMRTMLQVAADVHGVLVKSVDTTYDAALAVIATADDFVATDEQARADYATMDDRVREAPAPVPPPSPQGTGDPEDPGAPGTETTPEPTTPERDRHERDHRDEDPTDRWGI